MANLSLKIEAKTGETHVGVSGEIDEAANFAPVFEKVAPMVVFDLGEVRRINSSGIRQWVNFVTRLRKEGSKIVLERCSVPIVQQLNMISSFRADAEIRSVYAPYTCASCNLSHSRLLPVDTNINKKIQESVPCPKCGRRLEFDDLPEDYLAFMS